MKKIVNCVIKGINEITGIAKEELLNNMDLNLLEEGLLDSVSIPVLIMNLEEGLSINININEMELSDFATINSIVDACGSKIK